MSMTPRRKVPLLSDISHTHLLNMFRSSYRGGTAIPDGWAAVTHARLSSCAIVTGTGAGIRIVIGILPITTIILGMAVIFHITDHGIMAGITDSGDLGIITRFIPTGTQLL